MTTPDTSAGGARRVGKALFEAPKPRTAAPNGVWGMALFLAAEVTLFGTLIGSYMYLATSAKSWPPHGIAPPATLLPTLATVYLLLTMIPVHFAARASRRGAKAQTIAWIVFALFSQAGYLLWQIILYIQDVHTFSAQGSAYGSIYYTLLTIHHAHVALGLALDLALIWQIAAKGLTRYWLIAVRNLALYWYVIDGLAVAVLLTQLSPSL